MLSMIVLFLSFVWICCILIGKSVEFHKKVDYMIKRDNIFSNWSKQETAGLRHLFCWNWKVFSRPPVQTSQEQFLNVLDDAISFYLLPVCQIEAKIRNAAHQWWKDSDARGLHKQENFHGIACRIDEAIQRKKATLP